MFSHLLSYYMFSRQLLSICVAMLLPLSTGAFHNRMFHFIRCVSAKCANDRRLCLKIDRPMSLFCRSVYVLNRNSSSFWWNFTLCVSYEYSCVFRSACLSTSSTVLAYLAFAAVAGFSYEEVFVRVKVVLLVTLTSHILPSTFSVFLFSRRNCNNSLLNSNNSICIKWTAVNEIYIVTLLQC